MERIQLWQAAGYIHIYEVNKIKKGALDYHGNIHTLTLCLLSGHCTLQELGSLIKAQLDMSCLWDFDSVSLRKLVQICERVYKLKQSRMEKPKCGSEILQVVMFIYPSEYPFQVPPMATYLLSPSLHPCLISWQSSSYVHIPFLDSRFLWGLYKPCQHLHRKHGVSLHAAKAKYCLTSTLWTHVLA